jgi:hypothetical protein
VHNFSPLSPIPFDVDGVSIDAVDGCGAGFEEGHKDRCKLEEFPRKESFLVRRFAARGIGGVVEWQTQQTQNLPAFTRREGSSPSSPTIEESAVYGPALAQAPFGVRPNEIRGRTGASSTETAATGRPPQDDEPPRQVGSGTLDPPHLRVPQQVWPHDQNAFLERSASRRVRA